MTETKDKKTNSWIPYVLGIVGWFIIFGVIDKTFFSPDIRLVNRETDLDGYGSYIVIQEFQNMGRSGNGTFIAEQNGRVVCQKHIFLNKGERRTHTIECPLMKDGMTYYSVK